MDWDFELVAGPTNCAFGGRGLDILYVTTHGGHLFKVANSGH